MGDREDRGVPRSFKVAVAVVAVLWIAALLILSRTHKAQPRLESRAVMPVHPSAVNLAHSAVPGRDWRTVTYSVPLVYPSLDVYAYYHERMTDQGWTRLGGPETPRWRVSTAANGRRATLLATWVSPDTLMQLDLVVDWREREGDDARGTMQVVATMQRTVVPAFADPRGKPRPEPKQPDSPFAER